MTVRGAAVKAAVFLSHGKVSATNLGKMNHSHFIWTSVLTSLPHDLHSFVTVLLDVLQVVEAQQRGDGPRCGAARSSATGLTTEHVEGVNKSRLKAQRIRLHVSLNKLP